MGFIDSRDLADLSQFVLSFKGEDMVLLIRDENSCLAIGLAEMGAHDLDPFGIGGGWLKHVVLGLNPFVSAVLWIHLAVGSYY